MAEKIRPCYHLIENAKKACENVGIVPKIQPIRGGTDGARLSFMGLPCPNLGTGGHAYHGPYEHITVEGMDIAFAGGKSAHSIKNDGKNIRLLIKAEKNDYDPMGIYRIVRFKASKKDRRIQWLTLLPAVLGSSDAQKKGYLSFSGHKYGNQSYLLTIPVSELEPGEYGIISMAVASAQEIPFGTFSITK